MSNFNISCYQSASGGCRQFTFYILSKGENAGKPGLTPWTNSFAVTCPDSQSLDFYYWLSYALWKTGRFKALLRGTAIQFLTITDTTQLLHQVAESIFPNWQAFQNVIEVLNRLKTARAHLGQCIVSNEKLQNMLLRIHF